MLDTNIKKIGTILNNVRNMSHRALIDLIWTRCMRQTFASAIFPQITNISPPFAKHNLMHVFVNVGQKDGFWYFAITNECGNHQNNNDIQETTIIDNLKPTYDNWYIRVGKWWLWNHVWYFIMLLKLVELLVSTPHAPSVPHSNHVWCLIQIMHKQTHTTTTII